MTKTKFINFDSLILNTDVLLTLLSAASAAVKTYGPWGSLIGEQCWVNLILYFLYYKLSDCRIPAEVGNLDVILLDGNMVFLE